MIYVYYGLQLFGKGKAISYSTIPQGAYYFLYTGDNLLDGWYSSDHFPLNVEDVPPAIRSLHLIHY